MQEDTRRKSLLSFEECITYWASVRPEAVALREQERALTFAELEERTALVASALLGAGLAKGDRIAWLGKNSDLYFTLFYGAARVGVVMVPIGWRLAPEEIAYVLRDTEARLLFTGPGFEAQGAEIAHRAPRLERVFGVEEARAWVVAQPRAAFEPAAPQDPVLQLYTSGTTGKPKGAVISNLNLFGLRLPSIEAGVPWSRWADGEVMLMCMPCAHIGGTGLGAMALAAGVTGLILAEFDVDGVLDTIAHHGVTRFFIVPAALQMIVNHPRASSVDFSRIKYIMYGAAPMPLELLRQCIGVIGGKFMQAYGMTEAAGTIAVLPPEDHDPEGNARMRSAGKAVPGVEISIMDETGNIASTGTVGEIATRSAGNIKLYWKLPEETTKALTSDGWLLTGDAGYLDTNGYLFIHDRVKDMIISGGENIYPAEVENAIYGHPAIAEVAVIGVPDEKWGEAVKAICVAKPGSSVDEADVIKWARDRIAGFKVPKSIDVISSLPRNAAGKILKKDLRASYWAGYERQVN